MNDKKELPSNHFWDTEEAEWGEEDEDEEDDEDYQRKPPVVVSSPSARASAPGKQGPDRHQPPAGDSRLGRDIQTGNNVDVRQSARKEGLYIIGIQGTGKSVLIENLIIQDIKQNNIGVCVLDPHGDLINAVLARLPDRRENDVIYLDIMDYRYPFGINLFECPDPTNPVEVQKIVDKVRHVFEKLLGVSHDTPLLLEYLTNCTRTLIANPGYTMADIPLLLQDEECRRKLVANVSDIDVQRFWRHHDQKKPADQSYDISSTLRRVGEFLQPLSRPIIGQSTSTIDLQTIMNEGKILLVKLSPELPSVSSLIGSLIIALFLEAAKSRADLAVNKRRQFNLYADEFQRFATEDFATLLEEARKYGIATTIAHQNRGQLDSKNSQLETNLKDRTRSAANLVVFRVNSKDAGDLAGEFDITPQEAWEEEIEPERIKVLRPQRHERVEEQVEVEVEEDIKAIPHKPLEFLNSSNHSHTNPKVREAARFIMTTLKTPVFRKTMTHGEDKDPELLIDNLLVAAMEGRFDYFYEKAAELIIYISIEIGWLNDDEYRHWYSYAADHAAEVAEEIDEMQGILSHALVLLERGDADTFKQTMTNAKLDPYMKKWKAHEEEYPTSNPLLRPSIEQMRQYMLKGYQPQTEKLLVFSSHLLTLCKGLHADPIRVPTGQKRMVKRREPRISYLTHESEKMTIPRKTIMHPKRTYADVHNEVASQLTNLPIYTAKVKITSDAGIKEHMIRTLDPKQEENGKALFGQALQDRLTRIKAQNMQDRYVRAQSEVEAEIRQRQEQCSEPPEAEPPISRHPQR